MIIKGKEYAGDRLIIGVDYTTSERAGAGGFFQVATVSIDGKSILTEVGIDVGYHYRDKGELIEDLGLSADADIVIIDNYEEETPK